MINEKIERLIEELEQECQKESLNTVFLISNGNNLTINTKGMLGTQILMASRFIEQEAEKNNITMEQLQIGALQGPPKEGEENV